MFDKLFGFVGYMLEKGYVKAWFRWLTWVSIVAGLIALGIKNRSWTVMFLGILSAIVLFFVALFSIDKLGEDIAAALRVRTSYVRIALLILGLGVTPAVILEVLRVAVRMVYDF
jgi:hypothetical protein